jgi:hypothetical protein
MGWVWKCPYCANDAGIRAWDLVLSFVPWRTPFSRKCPKCGKVAQCQPDFRSTAWYRFGMVTVWPVLAYALRITLYASEESGYAAWAGGFMVSFIPALVLSGIPGRIGCGIEGRRSPEHPESTGGMVWGLVWLALMIAAVLAIRAACR